MARQDYQQQLESLREDVLYMSELVLERLRMSFDALEQKDEAIAEQVIQGDHEINQLYLDLEQDCIDILALQQPVAGDLRFIASSFKIITDLERIGDLATNLAEYSLNAEQDIYPEVDVQGLGDLAHEMVEDAMDAYATDDPDACRKISRRDDEIDALCEEASQTVVRDLLEREFDEKSSEDIEALMNDVSRLLLTIRDLERISDHAVNISARTLYMIESDDELIY
ncbi:phosphate signaling complex protein PhoU [Natranaeroarchaeum aerophilus]|uniref:Phosphate-specific transport system accessory protein PhoU n=1 Tax=Natranaeroarchaeum aerophilus TaxID=2917711 RepID=A0AAE3K3Y5_9EURY|nr:phosphate signaling complex protein PhoU [Natranaeroarchaeum aerophilus]MCL9812818.1 phosphate signaling complex protein PhoU [Natranaeroarchaeum aerophilus]